jgi:hypothetical protein
MASGEMSDDQFLAFNAAWIGATLRHLCDGGVFGTFIDWRGNPIVHAAAIELGLTALNLVVWVKTNAGMGSLYRSQHELPPLFKWGNAPHVNNVELDLLYVDVIIRRYELATGKSAVLQETGETFGALADRREREAVESPVRREDAHSVMAGTSECVSCDNAA